MRGEWGERWEENRVRGGGENKVRDGRRMGRE